MLDFCPLFSMSFIFSSIVSDLILILFIEPPGMYNAFEIFKCYSWRVYIRADVDFAAF